MLKSILFLCDPCRIQTCNLLIRSQMLYSVELRGRCPFIDAAKVHFFFIVRQKKIKKKIFLFVLRYQKKCIFAASKQLRVLGYSIKVVQQILVLSVEVRILVTQLTKLSPTGGSFFILRIKNKKRK